jgi:hypothetical protein
MLSEPLINTDLSDFADFDCADGNQESVKSQSAKSL